MTSPPPTRRSSLPILLAGLFMLASCAAVDPPAAIVGEHELAGSTFREVLAATSPGDPTANADVARQLLSDWIESQVLVEELGRRGDAVTDADRAEAEARRSEGDPSWAELPPPVQTFFRDIDAAQLAFTRAVGPTEAELEATYEAGGETSGVICIRAILVETEAEAREVLAELRAGGDFAELAQRYSIDPTGADGGIVEATPGNPCLDTTQLQPTPIVAASLETPVGEVSDPVQIDVGWVVVLPRPFEEVAEPAGNLLAARATVQLQQQLVTSATATVRSRYGSWVPELGAVLPVGRGPRPGPP